MGVFFWSWRVVFATVIFCLLSVVGYAEVPKHKKSPDPAAVGAKAFKPCGLCHGDTGQGRIGVAPSLDTKSFWSVVTDAQFADMARKLHAHTDFADTATKLSQKKIKKIIGLLRKTPVMESLPAANSEVQGKKEAGQEKYTKVCAMCHGPNGLGYREGASAPSIKSPEFLGVVSDGYLRHMLKHGKEETMMRSFEPGNVTSWAALTDAEIEDIITFLRAPAL